MEERHRHRYEVNPKYVDALESAGLSFAGRDETGERMEITELKGICAGGYLCDGFAYWSAGRCCKSVVCEEPSSN